MARTDPQGRKKQMGWALGIFVLALLAFNFPLLGIFREARLIAGIPSLLWYILAAWSLTILATFWVVRNKGDES